MLWINIRTSRDLGLYSRFSSCLSKFPLLDQRAHAGATDLRSVSDLRGYSDLKLFTGFIIAARID